MEEAIKIRAIPNLPGRDGDDGGEPTGGVFIPIFFSYAKAIHESPSERGHGFDAAATDLIEPSSDAEAGAVVEGNLVLLHLQESGHEEAGGATAAPGEEVLEGAALEGDGGLEGEGVAAVGPHLLREE